MRRIWRPISVPPGSAVSTTARPRSRSAWARSRICVVLPQPSKPSNVMKSPRCIGKFDSLRDTGRLESVSVYEERREELEKHEFMMGIPRGRLAVALDVLTDALVLVGQHGVYCQSARQPGKPAMDIQIITKSITDAKELISGVMTEIKKPVPERS